MTKRVQYKVSVGAMYVEPLYFDTYEEAKAEYEDLKTYTSDCYIGLSKVTTESLENEYIPFREDDDDE